MALGRLMGVHFSETEAKSKIHKLEKENAELKAMLKQAIADIRPLLENSTCLTDCEMCAKDAKLCIRCYEPTWKCTEQALKLIGDESNDIE